MDLPTSHGKAEWEYVFPIRGVYRLEVSALDEEGKKSKRVFKLRIRENRRKLFYLGGFVITLFLLGFTAGRLFTYGNSRH